MSRAKESTKSLHTIWDGPAANSNQGESGLQKQACHLLTDPNCNEAFATRMSKGCIENTDSDVRKAAFGGKESMDLLNMNSDQALVAVEANANADTLSKLMETDIDMAATIAVKHTALHTAALNTENEAFNERVRVRITGYGNS